MSDYLDVKAYVLYSMCLVCTGCVYGDVLLDYFSVNIQNLVCGSRPPCHTSFFNNTHYICPHHIVLYILCNIRH